MSDAPDRQELDAAVMAWMAEPHWHADEKRFDDLARALFAHQFDHCEPYRRFCQGRGRTPEGVSGWREIPPVPTGAFKELPLRCFPEKRTVHTFRTSGTSLERRGALHLDTLAVYEASLLPSFVRFLLPDLTPEVPEATMLVLAPSPGEAPDSSLSHMFATAVREVGDDDSRFLLEGGKLLVDALLGACAAARTDRPLLLAGTAFAFVHLLDALQERGVHLALPGGTRLMETGGFKGRSRVVSRPALYAALEDALGVPVDRMVNQYGMTELGSQFYDTVLREPTATRRKLGPPWARVRLVDPRNGEEVAHGETGAIVVTDLANTGSLCCIQTADLGRAVEDGFEVLGREPGAEERGCSLAAELLLSGSEA